MSALLWQSSLRHLTRHPWQLALAVLGIALGVAVVLAIDLANASARRSFELSMEQISGRTTHRIIGGSQGVPEGLYTRLRIELGLRKVAPVVTGHVALAAEPGRRLQILGVDIFAEAPLRSHVQERADTDSDLTALLTEPDTALLPRDLGQAGEVQLLIGERQVRLRSVGLLDDATQDSLILTDISTAQALFGQQGWLSHIDLILPEGETGERLMTEIGRLLSPDLRLERAAEYNQAVGELSASFQLNLTALSLLALVVGMFLIYNTMTFTVVQRRALLGRLRALGVSRGEVFTVVLGEAVLLGLIGTLLGGLLGLWLGSALVQLVTRTIDDLYYVVTVREYTIAPFSLAKAAALGLLASVAAAWLPAREAAYVPPGAALSRAHLESRWQGALPYLNLTGLTLLGVGGGILALSKGLIAGFFGLFVIILACALLTPSSIVLLARLGQGIAVYYRGLLPRMALRDVVRNLSRTGVAVAALMVAFAATIGVSVMVDSFRGGVVLWLEDLLNADLYIAPLSLNGGDAALQPEVLAGLRNAPGVAAVSTYRGHKVKVGRRLAYLTAVDLPEPARAGYRFSDGHPQGAWQAFAHAGAILISEPLAYHHGLSAGDTLPLYTDHGPRAFTIAGVFYDYGSEHGRILIQRATYDRLWNDSAVGSAGVYAAPDQDLTALRSELERTIGRLQALTIRSNRDIRERTLAIFDRTFTITAVLRLLAVSVAFVGLVSALMALQLERTREFAVLRASGMTPGEIGRLVSLQTGFMGLAAGLLAIPVGLLMAGLLIFVIQRRAFGWTLPLQIDAMTLIQAVMLAILAALLAGIYPLWRMARTSPAKALRSE